MSLPGLIGRTAFASVVVPSSSDSHESAIETFHRIFERQARSAAEPDETVEDGWRRGHGSLSVRLPWLECNPLERDFYLAVRLVGRSAGACKPLGMALRAGESGQSSPGVDRPVADGTTRVARAAVMLVGLLVGTAITAHLVDFGVYGLRIHAMNANLGTSPVAWASPAAILLALAASIVLVRRTALRVTPVLSISLAIVLVLATRHLGESIPGWQLLLLPPLGVTLAMLWRTSHELDSATSRLLRAGCVLLVAAFALHTLGAPALKLLGFDASSWPYQIKVAVKEGSEICGWMLIAAGLAVAAGSELFRRNLSGPSQMARPRSPDGYFDPGLGGSAPRS